MQNTSLARKAGMIGMIGAVLWLISNVLEASFGLYPPDGSGPLYVADQLLSLVALACVAYGILGIRWGGGVSGRFGTVVVWIWSIGTMLIILGGIAMLFLRTFDSPLLIVFPIGGNMMDVGTLLTGIVVFTAKRWSGWQRSMPLIYAVYILLAIAFPMIVGVSPDGPTFAAEIGRDIGLFFVALAVYTAQTRAITLQPATLGQV